MSCQHPLSFLKNEEVFTIALDSTIQAMPENIRLHIEQCERCQRDLMNYKHINQTLLTTLYRKECPGSMTLNAYVADLLSRDEQIPVQMHLRVCPLCTAEVDEVRKFFSDTEGVI